ncbi:MAG: c-type cytochrome [Acidobacteria bacterium]|nr:c-type cytochrome [Acidobacteriota bacterium]
MRVRNLAVAAGVAVVAVVTFGVVHGSQGQAWPPAVVAEDPGAPALTAEESMKTIAVPPGYRVELVAKEPMVIDPILAEFDADGRMWVVEMPGFAMDMAMSDSREPICRVVVLEDTNDDGTMDTRTVFADGLVLPRAIKPVDGGVLVGEPPMLWLMRDTNGDLKMDTKEAVADTYGRREANPEHNANSLIWGLDNWIYTSEHDWHLRFRAGKYEVVPTLSRGQWGGAIDDAGRIYRNVNSAPLFTDFTLARYFVRNPNVARTRGLYEPVISIDDAVVWPIRPTKGVNRGYREQFFRPDGSSVILQSAGTPLVYRGDRLPKDMQGNVFVTDSTTNLVHRMVMVDDGTGRMTAKNAYEKGEIFASSDERVRPVSLTSGPDGTLYIVDMYRGVVQDVQYQTEYLQEHIRSNKLEMPIGRGRIWRLTHDTTQRDRKPQLSKETPAGLVQYLSHPNGWWRDTAQQLIVQRQDASVAPAVKALMKSTSDWRVKLHVMGVLDGLGALDVETVQLALADTHPDVRAWGIRWSERWLAEPNHPLATTVLNLMNDANWIVRRQLAASIGELPAAARVVPAATMLERFGGDPLTVDAVISGLRGIEHEVFSRLTQAQARAVEADGVAMLVAAIARGGNAAQVQSILAAATDASRPEPVRQATLRGLDTGLPAAGAGGRGGRAGGAGAGGRGGAAAATRVTLAGEPTALTALANGSSALAAPAKAVVAKLDWPGKPAPVATVPPLTAEEQKRFVAGAEIYKNLCIACHQPTGLGLEKVAPALVGSPLLVGNEGAPIRIILGGKEGTTGLMPPLSMLNDEQIASVLTYVRREWGNQASAVTPESVLEIRGLTSTRKRPWTNEELLPAGRGGGAGRAGGAGGGRGGQ